VSEELLRGVIAGRIGERLAEAGDSLAPERRLITALFADVSGFTALADRLEPEELLGVIDPVISGLSTVVLQFEGYIEKFAGDALLALFGAPVAHEDDPERALLCALEMHRELARIVRELPEQPDLTLHVGVNSGHGIGRLLGSEARSDYAVLGDSVILAQRLESAAPPGETYVSQLTYELTNQRFEFDPVGELTLKGKAKPVSAWRLLRANGHPAARGTDSTHRLVGREDELSALSTVLQGVVLHGGGTVTVLGEAGIGKSRLTEEAKAGAEARQIRWLEARCLSYGAALPYWPYADLLRRCAGITGEESADEATAHLDEALGPTPSAVPFFSRLLGLPLRDRDSGVTELEPEAFRRRLHLAFKEWLTQLAGENPVVLSLEDVHWADSSTIELTRELAELTADAPLVLYLIGRPEAREQLAQTAPQAVRIEVGPLADAQVAAVIESILGGSPPRQLPRIVQQHTGGNPFFVQELVKSLRDTGDLVERDGVWRLRSGWEPSDFPPTLEGALASRIDLLPLPAANALRTASVVGRHVRLPLLRAVATDMPDLDESLEHLVAAGFLDPSREQDEDALVFHHALVQDVAYGQLLRRQRRELHLRVADAAESLYGARDDTIELLARHLYLGGAGPKATPYLTQAAARARALFANNEAIVHFRRTLEIAPEETEARLELADLYELVGDYDQALGEYDVVRSANGDLRAWYGTASTQRKRGAHLDALEAIDTAFAYGKLAGQDLSPLWLEAGRTLSVTGRNEQAIDVLNAGLEVAGTRRDPPVGRLFVQLARLDVMEGRWQEALTNGLEAQRIFEEHRELHGLATALRVLCSAYFSLERFDDAANAARRGLELAERIGNAEEIGGCLMNLGHIENRRGNREVAIQHEREAVLEFERIGLAFGRAQAYANLAASLEESDELDEALVYCKKAQEVARAIDHPPPLADTYNTMACISLKRGDFAEAGAMGEEAAEIYLRIGDTQQAREILQIAGDAWEKAGKEERARDCRSRARQFIAA
jgi:class 3 adenylate cyclase/tetratricopeptide (TPR) repeat protein